MRSLRVPPAFVGAIPRLPSTSTIYRWCRYETDLPEAQGEDAVLIEAYSRKSDLPVSLKDLQAWRRLLHGDDGLGTATLKGFAAELTKTAQPRALAYGKR